MTASIYVGPQKIHGPLNEEVGHIVGILDLIATVLPVGLYLF